jgi:hypothetical protein
MCEGRDAPVDAPQERAALAGLHENGQQTFSEQT